MGKANKANSQSSSTGDELIAMMDAANVRAAKEGLNYRAYQAEYITAAESREVGTTVFAKDVGNKQLPFDFVPNDVRRGWSGPPGGSTDDITYAVDTFVPQASNLPLPVTEAAIDRAMGTWDGEQCSDLPINKTLLPPGIDIGILGGGFLAADINHGGWLPLGPDILGVTFTFGFCSPCAPEPVFTDIDDNGKLDAAFREIYYNSEFSWADDGNSNVEVETVALHEAGHGLSQEHFGKVFITNKNGKVHIAPRAVMNALYAGPQRSLLGTDNGGHCSNWAEWPNN